MWFDFYPAYLYRLIEVFDTGNKLFLTCVKVILDIKTTFFFEDDLFVGYNYLYCWFFGVFLNSFIYFFYRFIEI